MSTRQLIVYAIAALMLYLGVQMMVDPDVEPEAEGTTFTEVDPELLLRRAESTGLPSPGSGWMGTGRPQVVFENMPEPRETKVRETDQDADADWEGSQRQEELDETLKRLGGLPVYVQGVDRMTKAAREKAKERR